MMIRRTHNRADDFDAGPGAAGIAGVFAVEAIALRAETFVAPVERRYLTPEELAVIRQGEPEPPKRPVVIDRSPQQMREAGRRGAAATARTRRIRSHVLGRPRTFTDAAFLDALRETHGSQVRAAESLGVSRSAVRKRLRQLRAAGPLPADVSALLRGPGGWWRWEKAA